MQVLMESLGYCDHIIQATEKRIGEVQVSFLEQYCVRDIILGITAAKYSVKSTAIPLMILLYVYFFFNVNSVSFKEFDQGPEIAHIIRRVTLWP